MRSAHAEVYRDIRGAGSITACHAVILHEFNGHACRYRRQAEVRAEGAAVLFYIAFRDAIATCPRPGASLKRQLLK